MIQYIVLDKKPNSIEEAIQKIRGESVQHQKLYINTNSSRNSRIKNISESDKRL